MTQDFGRFIGPLARRLLGEPNARMSSKTELRYGTHGSLSIDLEKGTWFDHEVAEGGGAVDLVTRERGLHGAECVEFLREQGFEIEENSGNGARQAFQIKTTYDYSDEAGHLLYQVCRLEPKDFRQRKPDGNGGWSWSVKGVRQVPYRLPELLEAIGNEHVIWIVEGEKDADRLWKLGLAATTNAGGANKWRPQLSAYFKDAHVIIVADNDEPGQKHARDVAAQLSGVTNDIRVLDMPELWTQCPAKGDISHFLDNGGTVEELNGVAVTLRQWNESESTHVARIVSKARFIMGFKAPDYLIDGILQRRYIYALTGQTGHAKTAVALLLAQLVGQIDPAYLINHRVERGRVIYFVGENPDDVRMRVIGADSLRNDRPELDNISFIPGVFNIEDMLETIVTDLQTNGEASLIIVDTSAAYFLGDDELSNTEMGNYARKLRRLTTLPGGPCVLVLCHPIKHVIDWTQLLPRGGGAYLAEMDGNLTLWRKGDDVVELNYTKIRGPGFQPITFQLETIREVPALVDSKGRKLPTVRAVAITTQEAEARENEATSDEDRVLAAMLRRPAATGGSFSVWATLLGWMQSGEPYKKRVERVIDSLDKQKPKLVKKERKSWVLTEEGKNVASKTVIKDEEAIDDQERMF